MKCTKVRLGKYMYVLALCTTHNRANVVTQRPSSVKCNWEIAATLIDAKCCRNLSTITCKTSFSFFIFFSVYRNSVYRQNRFKGHFFLRTTDAAIKVCGHSWGWYLQIVYTDFQNLKWCFRSLTHRNMGELIFLWSCQLNVHILNRIRGDS